MAMHVLSSPAAPRVLSRLLWVLTAVALGLCALVALRLTGEPPAGPTRAAMPEFAPATRQPAATEEPEAQAYLPLARNDAFGAAEPAPARPVRPAASAPAVDLTVVGTIVHGSRAVAIVRAAGGQRLLRVGDEIQGGRVMDISDRRVVLEVSGRPVEVPITTSREAPPSGTEPAAPTRPRAVALAPEEQPEEGETRYEEDVADIELEEFADFAARLQESLEEAALGQAYDVAGEPMGVVLSRLPEQSLLYRIGLRPGDIITEVNALPVRQAQGLRATFESVAEEVQSGEESFVVIDLIREQRSDTVILTIW
ncbi:MAG: type II secretion system protein N [Candidatus Brocadiia bacterium]